MHLHEGGWTITRGPDGAFCFHSPSGRPLGQSPPQEPVDDIYAWMRDWADEHDLDLGPDINMPAWDGTKPDYDLAIGGMFAAT